VRACLLVHTQLSSHCAPYGKIRGAFWGLLWALIPFTRAPPPWPNPNTLTLRIRFQHTNFGEITNIQPMSCTVPLREVGTIYQVDGKNKHGKFSHLSRVKSWSVEEKNRVEQIPSQTETTRSIMALQFMRPMCGLWMLMVMAWSSCGESGRERSAGIRARFEPLTWALIVLISAPQKSNLGRTDQTSRALQAVCCLPREQQMSERELHRKLVANHPIVIAWHDVFSPLGQGCSSSSTGMETSVTRPLSPTLCPAYLLSLAGTSLPPYPQLSSQERRNKSLSISLKLPHPKDREANLQQYQSYKTVRRLAFSFKFGSLGMIFHSWPLQIFTAIL
jgi:hypothetical protein